MSDKIEIPYFKFDSTWFTINLMNKQTPHDLDIKVSVYLYHGKTNYPRYLDRPNYYLYSHTLKFLPNGEVVKIQDVHGQDQILMGWADPRTLPHTEEELIEMIKFKFKIN